MNQIRLLFLSTWFALISISMIGQSTIEITTSGGNFPTEKWVSITTAANGGGMQVWGQGDGTYGNGQGLLTNESISLAAGTYYVNCYDRYADSWDGTLISVTAYGSVIGDNGGASPNDGTDNDATSAWETPADELEASFMIVVPAPPACLAPSNIMGANITATGIDLSWTDGNTAPNGFIIEYGTSGFTLGNGTGTNSTITSINLTGLTANTAYDVYISTFCGAGNGSSSFAGPYTFTTLCAPLTAPYTESFDGTSTPTCWLQSATSGGPWEFGAGFNSSQCAAAADHTGNGGNYAWMDQSGGDGGVILEMPEVDVAGLTTPYLEFYHYLCTAGYSPANETYVEAYDGTTWSQVALINTGSGAWEKFGYNVSSYVYNTSIVKFRFRAESGGSSDDFYGDNGIDDVSVIEAPSCTPPSNIMGANITATSIDLSWTDGNTAPNGFVIEYGTSGFTLGNGTNTSSTMTSINLTGLTANTTYDVYVSTFCGAGNGASSFVGPYTFSTPCAPIAAPYTESFDGTSTPTCWSQSTTSGGPWEFGAGFNDVQCSAASDNTGNGGNYAWMDQSGGDAGVILEMPEVDVAGLTTPYLEFYHYLCTTGYTPANETYVEAYDGTTWSQVALINTGSGAWERFGYDVSSYVYNTSIVKFRFRAESGGSSDDFYGDNGIDDVSIIEQPSCFAPSNVMGANITTTSIDLSWTDGNTTPNGFVIEYGTSGFTLGNGTSTSSTMTSINLTGLTPNTTYDVYVSTFCGAGNGASNFTGPYTFSTPCNPYTAPYFEGFEAGYTQSTTVGGCLSQESVSGGNTWEANDILTDRNRSPRTGSWNAYLRWGNEDWLFIPIDLTAGKLYQAEVYARQDGTNTSNSDIAISYGTTGDAAGMTNSIVAATGIDDNYQLIGGTFTPMTTGTYYVGIKGFMNSSPWYISIDDIAIYEVLADDVMATAVSAGNCSSTESVTIDIRNNGTNTQTSIPVSYSVNGGTAVNETWTGSLATGATTQYTFTATFDASMPGTYMIDASTALMGDQNTANDMTTTVVTTAPVYATALFEDFEAAAALPTDWSTTGGSVANAHNSGSNVIFRNMFNANTDVFVTTLPKVGPIAAGDSLMFDYRYVDWASGPTNGTVGTTLGTGDTLNVQISTDCGQTFTTIHQIHAGNHVVAATYARSKHDISMYAGQTVVARIDAVRATGDYYLDLDNFFVGARLGVTATESSPISCNGNTDGEVTAVTAGGVAPFTYLWDDAMAQTTMTATNLAPGTYTVTVTDVLGDNVTSSVTISEPMVLTASVMGTDISCLGANDGSVDLTVTGGTGPYTYAWSNGATTEDISGLGIGTFDVMVTDANGCTAQSSSVTIAQPTGISSSTTSTDIACNGDSTGTIQVNVSGGTMPYTYAWNNGATTANISGLPAGTYTLTITDANGCTSNVSRTLNEATAITIAETITDASCNGAMDGSIMTTITGGAGGYTSTWSGNINPSAVGAGTYTLTVTDASGCTTTASYTVNEPTAVTGMTTVTQTIDCAGDTGAVSITASGGVGPYTVVWTDAAGNTVDENNVTAGVYTANITDATGCTGSETVTITEPSALSASPMSVADTNNLMTGTASANVSGGTPPYTINWDNGMSGDPITGLSFGTYTFTATDANGCTITGSTTVDSLSTSIEVLNSITSLKVFPNPTAGNVTIDLEMSDVRDVNVAIYNMAGQLVRDFGHETTSQTQIRMDMSVFPSGVYMIRFVIDDQVVTKRLILSKY